MIAPGTQKMRVSTGIELQVMLPVVNAPFRLYWAYNPFDRAGVPAAADRGGPLGLPEPGDIPQFGARSSDMAYPFFEKRTMFRFTIGRTF